MKYLEAKRAAGPKQNKALAGPPENKAEPASKPSAPTLAGIDFASDEAAEYAAEMWLNVADFAGYEPSGVHGYTKADVRAVSAARDAA